MGDTQQQARRLTAFHEAGHAVVGVALGFRIDRVTIVPEVVPDGTYFGRCLLDWGGDWSIERANDDDLEGLVIFLYAGAIAMRLVDPDAEDDIYDDADALEISNRVSYFVSSLNMRQKAGQLVKRNAEAIAKLADELLRRGTLDGAEVQGIIRRPLVQHGRFNRFNIHP